METNATSRYPFRLNDSDVVNSDENMTTTLIEKLTKSTSERRITTMNTRKPILTTSMILQIEKKEKGTGLVD